MAGKDWKDDSEDREAEEDRDDGLTLDDIPDDQAREAADERHGDRTTEDDFDPDADGFGRDDTGAEHSYYLGHAYEAMDDDAEDLRDLDALPDDEDRDSDDVSHRQQDAITAIDEVFQRIDESMDDDNMLFDWQVDDSGVALGYEEESPVQGPLTSDQVPDPGMAQAPPPGPDDEIDFDIMDFSATLDRAELPAKRAGAEANCQVTIDPTLNHRWLDGNATSAGVCLLVDCSLSMYGDKFHAAVDTARLIAEILHERHFLSVIAFHTRSHVIVKNVVPSEANREAINQQIDALNQHLGGSTNLAAGIESAIQVLGEAATDSKIVLIISDGEPNSFAMAQKQAEIANQKGIQFHAVGIGDAYNASQLLRLVTPYNGAVYGDNEVKNMDRIFRDLVDRIGKIFATNVRLNIKFDSRVDLGRVFKTSPERVYYDLAMLNYRDHALTIPLGNMEGDKHYEFLLQLELGEFEAGRCEIMALELQYDINYRGNRVTETLNFDLEANFTEDVLAEAETASQIDDALNSASVMQRSSDLLQAIDDDDREAAQAALDDLKRRSEAEGNVNLQERLDEIQSRLDSGARLDEKARNDLLLAASVASAREKPMVHQAAIADVEPEPEVEAPAPVIEEAEPLFEAPETAFEEPEPAVEEPDPTLVELEAEVVEITPLEDVAAPVDDGEVDEALYQVYDLVLIDVGADPIRFMRETRHATRLGLRQIADVMRKTNTLLYTFEEFADAEALQLRLTEIGARTELYGRHDGTPR